MSEILIPDDELPEGWREGMAEIARRTLSIFKRHPWVVERMNEGTPSGIGPSMLRHVEQTLAVASRSGLDIDDQFELSAVVDDYVFGHAIRTYSYVGPRSRVESRIDAPAEYVTEQLETGEFPNLQRSVGADVRAALLRARYETADDERFERGLQRVPDGLELWVRDRRPQ